MQLSGTVFGICKIRIWTIRLREWVLQFDLGNSTMMTAFFKSVIVTVTLFDFFIPNACKFYHVIHPTFCVTRDKRVSYYYAFLKELYLHIYVNHKNQRVMNKKEKLPNVYHRKTSARDV